MTTGPAMAVAATDIVSGAISCAVDGTKASQRVISADAREYSCAAIPQLTHTGTRASVARMYSIHWEFDRLHFSNKSEH